MCTMSKYGKICLILFIAISVIKSHAQDLYVSPDGDDSNPGTLVSPFATIQAAADMVSSGGTVYIREGQYHEEIVIRNKKPGSNSPLVFKAYNNEAVVIDGTVDLEEIKASGTNWVLATDSFPGTTTIYKITLEQDVWQLFVRQPENMKIPNAVKGDLANYRMQSVARWPNAYTNPADPITRKNNSPEASSGSWWSFGSTWGFAAGEGTNHTTITNNTSRYDLAATGLSFEGGTAIISAIKQGPANQVVEILVHEAGSNVFEHSGIPTSHEIYGPESHHGPSYFVQHLKALDRPGEWYYDVDSKTVYLWPEGDVDPNSLQIRGKNQTYGITLDNCSNIIFDGIGLFATSMNLDGDHISYINGAISYPDMPKTLLGIYTETVPAIEARECQYFNLINCIVECSMAHLVQTDDVGAYFENNYFRNLGIIGSGTTGCFMGMNTFIYNTLETIGHRAAIKANSSPEEGRIQSWNMFSGWGFLYANDGVGIQTNQAGSVNSVRSHTWFIRSNKPGHRYDGPDEGKGFPTLGLSHHLVGYKTMSVSTNIKGDYNELYNYLGIESLSPRGDIAVRFNVETGEGNKNTIMRNCAADGINLEKWVPIPCINTHNWDASKQGGSMSDFHPGASIFDFRPRSGAPTIDAAYEVPGITDGYLGDAPDIGAYEWGDDTYWIPGYKGNKTSFPIPQNGSVNMSVDRDIMFKQAYQCDSAIVYFSTNETNVINATPGTANDPGTVDINSGSVIKVVLDGGRNIVTPTMLKGNPNGYNPTPYLLLDDPTQVLAPNTTYYWRADAINNQGSISEGEVWSFTTGNDAYHAQFKVYLKKDDVLSNAENATIILNGKIYQTDDSGLLSGVRLPSGDYSYTFKQKGYQSVSGNFTLISDSLISDTIVYTTYKVSIQVIDNDTEESLPGAEVQFGEQTYTADDNGSLEITDIPFDVYSYNALYENYREEVAKEIEIVSDTNLILKLKYDYQEVSMTVVDLSSEVPVNWAYVTSHRESKVTNTDGLVILGKVTKDWWKYKVTHEDYFPLSDSVYITKDTSFTATVTNKVAKVTFDVKDENGPLSQANVSFGIFTFPTDEQGIAFFPIQAARKEYSYNITKEGYIPATDEFFLEKDTTISVQMEIESSAHIKGIENNVSIYPIPAANILYIENIDIPSNLELFHIDGKVITNTELPNGLTKLIVEDLESGYYYLRISNNKGSVSRKLLIK